MEIANVEPLTILSLDDDCLETIFKLFSSTIKQETCYYDGTDYTDILFQLKIAGACKRFCNIFIEMIWKSKEKHLTLRPQQLYRTLGPMNASFYMQVMQQKLIKLELEENYIPWFLCQALTADIESFPCIQLCVLKNSIAKPVKEHDIEQIISVLLPNLNRLSLTTAVKESYFEQLKSLQEFNFYNKYPMSFSYFQTICTTLENLRILNITAPLKIEFSDFEFNDIDDPDYETPLTIAKLPENLEILVLNVTAARALLAAIFKLKKLEKLILTILCNQSISDNVQTVNSVLMEKSKKMTGFGLNKMFDSALRVWNFPKCLPKLKRIRKFIFSAYEYIPSLVDFKRLINFSNLNAICLKNCFIIQNETVLKLVKLAKKLIDLDISGCYLIDAESLLINLFDMRTLQIEKSPSSSVRPLCIYTDENLDIKLQEFWKMQQLIIKGDKCPIDVEETGFVFDFM